MDVIGISCFYHDSAACLVRDGKLIAAAQEERFSRQKNTDEFPIHALNYCSQFGNVLFDELAALTYFEKPYLKFSRVLINHLQEYPFSLSSFLKTIPQWMGKRLILPLIIEEELSTRSPVYFFNHHLSHAASAFLPSPFAEAAILTCDGVGEWTTTSIGLGRDSKIQIDQEISYPDSLGLLYTTFTVFLGFGVHGEEGKTMAMAAYGKPRFLKEMQTIIHIHEDGSFKLNQRYFSFRKGQQMWSKEFEALFGPPHRREEAWTEREFDMAASLQLTLEKAVILMTRYLYKKTKVKNLCLAGGVALNCVANAKILEETDFENIFVQPAAGDAGGAIGAALYYSNSISGHPRHQLENSFLGPEFSEAEILVTLKSHPNLNFHKLSEVDLVRKSAQFIYQNKTLAWFQGRMEFGPRSLGGRSILANPCSEWMKNHLNTNIKKRESFRPFAPMILEEECSNYFNLNTPSPYMLLAPKVKPAMKQVIPAVVHIDDTARVQTVGQFENPLLRKLLVEFKKIAGVPILLNTSFNQNKEPVVCTPENAIKCFLNTEIDALAIGPFWVEKK